MKRILILPLLLASAIASPIIGAPGVALGKIIKGMKGKTVVCEWPERRTPRYQTTCATVPLNEAQFKAAWAKQIKARMPTAKTMTDWQTDAADPDMINAMYEVGKNWFSVGYISRGKSGYLNIDYGGP